MAGKNSNLEQALAILIQNQAQFVAGMAESERRFSRIERELEQIKKILVTHGEVLAGLPEAIRQKIGFKAK
jgi:hypothetical protein